MNVINIFNNSVIVSLLKSGGMFVQAISILPSEVRGCIPPISPPPPPDLPLVITPL